MRKHRDPQRAGTKELGYLDHLPLLAVLRHQLAFDLFLWQRRKHLGAISDTDCWLLHLERLGVPWPLQCSKGENGMINPFFGGSAINCFTLPPKIMVQKKLDPSQFPPRRVSFEIELFSTSIGRKGKNFEMSQMSHWKEPTQIHGPY